MRALTAAFAVLFSLAYASSAQAALHLKVTPTTTTVGKQTCFEYSTTGANGKPKRGVSVRFMNEVRTTNRDGRARACVELEFAGRFSVWATAKGTSGEIHSTSTEVQALRHGLAATGGSWHRFYEGTIYTFSCVPSSEFGEVAESCEAEDAYNEPYLVSWRPEKGNLDLKLETGRDNPTFWVLSGFLPPHPAPAYKNPWYYSPGFYVTAGQLPGVSTVISGSNPAKVGEEGGPLRITSFRTIHGGTGFLLDGYLWY